jgi:acyl carrier protein phosphodiesterase
MANTISSIIVAVGDASAQKRVINQLNDTHPFLANCIGYNKTSNSKIISTIEELDAFIAETYGDQNDTAASIIAKDKRIKQWYNKMKSAIKGGKSLVCKLGKYDDLIMLAKIVSHMASRDANIKVLVKDLVPYDEDYDDYDE